MDKDKLEKAIKLKEKIRNLDLFILQVDKPYPVLFLHKKTSYSITKTSTPIKNRERVIMEIPSDVICEILKYVTNRRDELQNEFDEL